MTKFPFWSLTRKVWRVGDDDSAHPCVQHILPVIKFPQIFSVLTLSKLNPNFVSQYEARMIVCRTPTGDKSAILQSRFAIYEDDSNRFTNHQYFFVKEALFRINSRRMFVRRKRKFTLWHIPCFADP